MKIEIEASVSEIGPQADCNMGSSRAVLRGFPHGECFGELEIEVRGLVRNEDVRALGARYREPKAFRVTVEAIEAKPVEQALQVGDEWEDPDDGEVLRVDDDGMNTVVVRASPMTAPVGKRVARKPKPSYWRLLRRAGVEQKAEEPAILRCPEQPAGKAAVARAVFERVSSEIAGSMRPKAQRRTLQQTSGEEVINARVRTGQVEGIVSSFHGDGDARRFVVRHDADIWVWTSHRPEDLEIIESPKVPAREEVEEAVRRAAGWPGAEVKAGDPKPDGTVDVEISVGLELTEEQRRELAYLAEVSRETLGPALYGAIERAIRAERARLVKALREAAKREPDLPVDALHILADVVSDGDGL